MEEAATILEAHLLAALPTSLEHVVLIGDHLQLGPQLQNQTLVQQGFDQSFFERVVNVSPKATT